MDLSLRASIFTALALLIVVSCSSSNEKRPPELGNCIPGPTTGCNDISGGIGGSVLPQEAGANAADAGIPVAEEEGGTCGFVDIVLGSPCGPCVAAACCMADAVCSADPGCASYIECLQNGGLCATLTLASSTNYQDLQTCFTLNCPQQCEALSARDP